nr:putative reverse transcriptase domain-containing protein [Tanacetum cinerariifolium]
MAFQGVPTCFECGAQGHFKNNCPRLGNRNQGNLNQAGNGNVVARAYGLGTAGGNPNANVVTELGSFDVIVGMDWLKTYHAVIVCDEKIIRVPFGNETLIIRCDGSNNENQLNIISYTKTRKYLLKGYPVFLANITTKMIKDKSEEKRLEDVPIVRDFLEVFPEDLPGLSPTQQVEFQIDLIPSAAPVARAPYRLAPYKMKELSYQLQELSNKGFIRPSSSPWGAPVLFVKKKDGSCLAGYYQRFIEGFSKIAKPMTKLTQKKVIFDWGDKQKAAFQLLKQKLCSAPILALPEGSEDFVAYCDASHKGLGAVLMQREKAFQKALGTRLDMSTAYHPQTDRQSERTIQTLEDMLRACVIDFGNGWERHLPLVKFSYNNSYHASIKAAPFEALYGRKCRSPICWAEVRDAQLTSSEIIQETTENVVQIKQRLQAARDHQKSYADVRRPFKVLAKVGTVAYRLELPQQLSMVHSTFHVSNLNKCLSNEPLVIPLDKLHIHDKLRFVEEPVEIMDREIKRLRQSHILIIKVRWNSKRASVKEIGEVCSSDVVLTGGASCSSIVIEDVEELVKICQEKGFLCIHDDVDDLIESALNSKLILINSNSQRLDKKKQEVKNVVEQPAERGNQPEHLLSMGYQHLSLTPEMESDEVIESNAENLLPIPSECEVTLEDKRECDLPISENSPVCDDHSDIFSDSKIDDDISVYDDDFEDIEYVEASFSDPEVVSVEEENGVQEENVVQLEEEEVDLEDISQIQDVVLREKLLSIIHLISNIESLNDNSTLDCVFNSFEFDNSLSDNFSPEFEIFCDYSEETRSGNTTHADNSFPEYDSFCFEIKPDQERLINLVKNDIPDNSSRDFLLEEADLFLSDNSIPPGIENFADDPAGDIRFLEELLIDDSILSHQSPDSNFENNPSISRPPLEPPDAETNAGEEIPVVINEKDEDVD